MKAQLNRVPHDPPRSYGDCYRTCVAALLDLPADDVPHVFSHGQDGPTAHAAMGAWLAARGQRLIWMAFGATTTLDEICTTIEAYNPGLPAIIGGLSRPGCGHFVVAQHGVVACDPAPGSHKEAPLIGPHDDGMWVVCFIGVNLR